MHPEESLLRRLRHAGEELRDASSEAGGIAGDIRRIARDEVALAAAEVREGVQNFRRAGIWTAIAAVTAFLTLLWLPLPIVLGLDQAMPMWAAALITVLGLMLLTLVVGAIALGRIKRVSLVPHGALERMKEDQQWLRQHLSAGHD